MGSQYADTSVEELDVANLSDEELQDVVDNDDRSTAVDKAQAELNRREKDDGEEGDADGPSPLLSLHSADPLERAEANGINTEGMNLDPDAGQSQVQAYADEIEVSGVFPPTGSPPDDSLTLEKAVEAEQAAKEARKEAQAEAWGK